MVSLLSLSGVAYTDNPSLLEIREEPISLARYVKMEVDFLLKILGRMFETAKPAFIFTHDTKGLLAIEITIQEYRWINIDIGKCLDSEKDYFIGLEIKALPTSSEIRDIFKYFRPGVAYRFDTQRTYFMITYEFRENSNR